MRMATTAWSKLSTPSCGYDIEAEPWLPTTSDTASRIFMSVRCNGFNAVALAEIAVEEGAKALLLPVSCGRQLFDLSDDMVTKLDIEFYQNGRDALPKALGD